jgi:hypothetical protein
MITMMLSGPVRPSTGLLGAEGIDGPTAFTAVTR